MRKIAITLASSLAAALVVVGSAAPSQSAEPIDSATRQSFTDSRGIQSWYHVYADGIDWSQDVGALYYFDGDYFSESPQYSQIMRPAGDVLTSVAKDANEKNLVVFAVKTPSERTSGNGWTWWENGDSNARWVEEFATAMKNKAGLDTDHTWLAGYSGGAELISFDLMTADRSAWMTDGGAILIAGGGSGSSTVPHSANSSIPMTWYAGANDGPGQTNPPTWSALGAAEKGYATYQDAGYTDVTLDVIPGVGHHDYNLAQLINQTTQQVPTTPTEPEPQPEPSSEPTPDPTPAEPTEEPAEEPTGEPSQEPTPAEPTDEPTEEPAEEPSQEPTPAEPTDEPSQEPTPTEPTEKPNAEQVSKASPEPVKIDSGNPVLAHNQVIPALLGLAMILGSAAIILHHRRRASTPGHGPEQD